MTRGNILGWLVSCSVVMVFSSLGFAESHVGNGGIGIVCIDKATTKLESVELLDYFEGRYLRNLSYEQTFSGSNLRGTILRRLQQLSPRRAKLYESWWDEFFSRAHFVRDQDLIHPDDSLHQVLRPGCKHKTLVLQSDYEIPGLPKYWINLDLFEFMPLPMQQMTIFHEILYREMIARGHRNSFFTRKFVAWLFADDWGPERQQELLDWMLSYQVPTDLEVDSRWQQIRE